MSRKTIVVALVAALAAGLLIYNSGTLRDARLVDSLVARNVEARGGAEAWAAVDSLRISGQMDLGQGMHVPYTIEQKRPGKMCVEFVFNNETATQCVDGENGWKRLPFRGSNMPEMMTELELREMADAAEIDGLLISAADRGDKIEFVSKEEVGDRSAVKLKVIMPRGAVRWIYIDEETGLDIKLESMRVRAGRQRLVETYYYDWQETDGLLIPRRQETLTEGDDEFHFMTVDRVPGNPKLDDSRFAVPALVKDAAS